MSQHDAGSDHHGSATEPKKKLATSLFFTLLVPVVIVAGLVVATTRDQSTVLSEAEMQAATAARLQKVGAIQLGEASHEPKTGEQVFQVRCSGCHGTGAAGAPKFKDAGAWGPRIKTGFASLLNSALHGKGNMTPQGGGDLSDLEIARGVVYMANAAGASFPEPKEEAAKAKK